MKIKIIVPDQSNVKWRISFGKKANRRLTAVGTLDLLTRRLPKILKGGKVSVCVDYGLLDNETLDSNDLEYLLFATSCFLEDYLSKNTMRRLGKERRHKAN